MEDPTYVNPFISLLLIAWGLAVFAAILWFIHSYCGIPLWPAPRERSAPPTTPGAPTCKWPHDPDDPEET